MRAPIILRPRALVWSMKDVPWWGHLVALAALAGVVILVIVLPTVAYVLGAFAILIAIGVRVADHRRQH